jgi:hypothetical protein
MLILGEIRDAGGCSDDRREFVLVLHRRQAHDAREVPQAAHNALGEPAFIALVTHVEHSVSSVRGTPAHAAVRSARTAVGCGL